MSPNHQIVQRRQSCVVVLSFRFFVAVIFLCLLSASSALGQATYSDEWLDDSAADDGIASVRGSGVTDGSYTHSYYVDTTLRSPNGRTHYQFSGRRTGYARSDVSLVWDWDDSGNYSTSSEHFARCPGDELFYYSIGTTLAAIEYLIGSNVVLPYYEVGEISAGICGYQVCANYVGSACYNFLRRTQTAPAKTPGGGEAACYNYLWVTYGVIDVPALGIYFCVQKFKLPIDRAPPGGCGL